MKEVLKYLQEVKVELSKVSWPKKEEVIRLTLIVLLISSFIGAYIGIIDFLLTKVLELLIKS